MAVKETCRYLEGNGYAVTYVGVDGLGVVSPASVVAAVQPSTRLITLMLANVGQFHKFITLIGAINLFGRV